MTSTKVANPLDGFDPLSSMVSNNTNNNTSGDPLSDPLSAMSMGTTNSNSNPTNSNSNPNSTSIENDENINETNNNTYDNIVSWDMKKQQIKNDYKVIGNITLSGSAIREFTGSGVEDGSGKKNVSIDVYSQRLANLERNQINEETVEMSQKEMESHINKLYRDLDSAWQSDERVVALKTGIQLAKLLVDTTVPQFYPSMFVMVTEKLDKFGSLVYSRLLSKSEEVLTLGKVSNPSTTIATINRKKVTKLISNFKAGDVPTEAKETCRNWFYKIACIKELLPRIYVEIALLKCYRFLADSEYQQIFLRIASLIRGLGDTLVASYCRLYLIVVGMKVAPDVTMHVHGLLQDTLFQCQMLKEKHHMDALKKWHLSSVEYSNLLSPAMEHMLKVMGKHCRPSKDTFQSLLQAYKNYSLDIMVLKHFIDAFDGQYYAHGALGMVTLIKSSIPSCISHVDAYASLAKQLVHHPPPQEQKIPLLNEVWKVVSKTEDIATYIRCCSCWFDVVQQHYTEREGLILMSDCSNKLSTCRNNGDEIPLNVASYLESLVNSMMLGFSSNTSNTSNTNNTSNNTNNTNNECNIDAIFTSEHFLKILDSFKGPRKVVVCKDILQTFKKHPPTGDAILINCLFDIGRTLHDSIDVLSPDGEQKHVSSLLCSFIDKIDFERDLEQQLHMYVECRAIFCNLDTVKDKLIVCVCHLAMRACHVMHGVHSKKTSSFVKACLAYCHITIPSIGDVYRKLQLLLICAEVSLQNQCLPQTDTCLKSAISLLPEMPPTEECDGKVVHTEDKLYVVLINLLSILVVAPGHPEHGPFYVVKGLFNALPKFAWQPNSGVQTKLYISILTLLMTYGQKKFPYHIANIESNDDLYGNSPGYMTELSGCIGTCMDIIITQLTTLVADKTDIATKTIQCKLILDLIVQLVDNVELTNETCIFMRKLLELCSRNKSSVISTRDIKYLEECVIHIQNRIKTTDYLTVFQPVLVALLQ